MGQDKTSLVPISFDTNQSAEYFDGLNFICSIQFSPSGTNGNKRIQLRYLQLIISGISVAVYVQLYQSANDAIVELVSRLESLGFGVKNYSTEYLTRPRFESGESANEADMYNISRHSDALLGHPFLQVYVQFNNSVLTFNLPFRIYNLI